ncbi:MAG: NUDIX domain-containing protein, partial [Bacteroidia bacterium]|nr:NUDIX domain-containing protein [Bacteroidia bacterium]
MKIFFDDRCLVLLKPDAVFEGQIVLPGSIEELEEVLTNFEKDSSIQELGLSSSDYKKLKRDLNSLFTIVKAAGGLVRNEDGEILFIHRRGRWDLPKGKLEIGNSKLGKKKSETCHCEEHSDEAKREANNEWRKSEAIREVKEETGLLEVEVIRKMKPTYHVYQERGRRMLKKSYWFEMSAPKAQKLIPQLEEDIRYVRWFKPEELSVVLENTFGSLREMILKMR